MTFLLSEPIAFDEWRISCLEIPCPKPGRVHRHGLEHMEVVIVPDVDITDGSKPFINSTHLLEDFIQKYPGKPFYE